MGKKIKIKSDEKLNPELAEEVQSLRGMIQTGPELKRFSKKACDDSPTFTITDNETGKSHKVPLFAVREVMETLEKLFC